ncbi:alpha-(1-_3)-arabinofuranosyltransferase domain-containing protein [Nocardia sp. NBC_01730]|uniref:alpha-(1->3)-arabinofuranosyltransferase domain-containing protein n=1 Tax=Nocardia sp. NBC_01730 TaxID=2975998 RepID=UPI003FA37331
MTSASPADSLGSAAAPGQHSTAPLGRRWFAASLVAAFLLTFAQAPWLTVADTKYDLAQNPFGFLERASHLWSSQAPMGQVQNQAYGYFFPHGAFFSLGHALGMPAWATQRIWWALLLLAGFWGVIRLCETLGIGTRGSRVVAAVAFALSPRVLTTLGSISSETLPMMLAPWVLLAPAALGIAHRERRRGGATSPAGSALALALMGSVNAVATVAAFLPALLWWAAASPALGPARGFGRTTSDSAQPAAASPALGPARGFGRTTSDSARWASYHLNRRWWRFTAAWIPLLVLATFWWVVPLLLLGKVSPPFLDYIESSGVTTQWASLGEVLRGTDSWTPFVSPERIAGAVLVTQPAAVLATGLLAAAGMAGLALRSMPCRGRLAVILCVGLVGICAGYVGELGGPFAESVRVFLDSGGAPLRNVHKLEPLIRIPLVLGLAQLLARVPLPGSVPMRVWRAAFAHPERDRAVAVAALILTALALSTSLAWTAKLAPRGAYDRVPAYWQQTADWLRHNASDTRALVVPGAPFGSQVWGLTRDEPLQALASTPWAIRDAVPLNPPGTIRAMDSVQRLIADGRPSAGLAETLAGQGIGIVVLRNDLDPDTSRSTRPILAHRALDGSPGLSKVAAFGNPIESVVIADGLVADGDLRPPYPAIEIYRVDTSPPGTPTEVRGGTGAPNSFSGAYTVPLGQVPVVQGGPEVLERLHRDPGTTETPSLLAADAARAGLPLGPVTITDTPMDREADFGRVDNHNSALRAADDARRTHNLVPDYPVPDTELVRGEWSGATITASSSAADATQLGGAAPGSSTAAVVDGDPATAWISNGIERALGQWLRLDLDHPIKTGQLNLTTSSAAIGDPVKWVEVRTANGTVSARVPEPGVPVSVSLPAGTTDWLTITAIRTESGSRGGQFGISELALNDYSVRDAPVRVAIRHRTVLPPTPAGAQVRAWDLGQEFPGRSACFDSPDRVRCSKGLALAPEEPGTFERTLSVPEPMSVTPELTVRTRQGPALEALLTDDGRPVARGKADVGDLRGAAFAATDGDPRTSWTAPEGSVRDLTGGRPTLTIELPEPALVTGLELTPSLGGLPAAPTSVTVNLGDGPQVRELDERSPGAPSRISLHPTVTDRIELSLRTWTPVLDQTALGFVQTQPPGLAEVAVLGPDYPEPAPLDREITVPCALGPTISVGAQVRHTTVTATFDELRSGAPVPARVCTAGERVEPETAPQGEYALPQGRVDVTVGPTDLFFVDRLRLNRSEPASATQGKQFLSQSQADVTVDPTGLFSVDPLRTDRTEPTSPAPQQWDADTRLLVLPLSTNVGWRATATDGRVLEPVVANGWQQAWLLPIDVTGPVTVSFPADRWYRLGIFGGLLLLLPLAVLAIPRRARREKQPASDPDRAVDAQEEEEELGTGADSAPRTWGRWWQAAVGLAAATTLIAGPVGTVATVIALAATRFAPHAAPRALVVVAGVGTALSATALSTGPWRSPDGYMGGSLLVQLPALLAVVAVGVAALPRRRGAG